MMEALLAEFTLLLEDSKVKKAIMTEKHVVMDEIKKMFDAIKAKHVKIVEEMHSTVEEIEHNKNIIQGFEVKIAAS